MTPFDIPVRPGSLRHLGNAAGQLEDSKTVSLWNLRQVLMGSFCLIS
jgi:hypothetical protein